MLRYTIPATTANLGPGFDTLGLAINIYSEFQVTSAEKDVFYIHDWQDNLLSIDKSDNLLNKSLLEFADYYQLTLPSIEIREKLKVPLARGMGSSAAAILGGLTAGAIATGILPAKDDFVEMAVKLKGHPDNVLPALFGGLIINYSDQERIFYEKIEIDPELNFILVIPDFELKTSELREILPKNVDYSTVLFNMSRVALLVKSFLTKDWQLLENAMQDKLHQPFRSAKIPGFNKIIATAYAAGARGAALSGAGPTILAITDKNPEKIAGAMCATCLDYGIKAEYLIAKADNQGLYNQLEELLK